MTADDPEAESLAQQAAADVRRLSAGEEIPAELLARLSAEPTPAILPTRVVRWWGPLASIAAALFLGVVIGQHWNSPGHELGFGRGADTSSTTLPTRFVFVAPAAARVALVGEFNGWDPATTPMHKSPDGTVWTATLPLKTGRHLYAYVVNDSIWVPDPQAPIAPEAWFGSHSSIILVAARPVP